MLLAAGLIGGACTQAAAQSTACGLATAGELRAALGASVTGLANQNAPAGASFCSGQTPTATVSLRLATRPGQPGDEAAAIDAARNMGIQVDLRTTGQITCSTLIPPKALERIGFNTTCAVRKNGRVAAIEVTAKTQQSMIPMERLRTVAEKMAGRF